MCGITGFFSYQNICKTKEYYKAHKKIAHRGPNDEGFICKNSNNVLEFLSGDDTIAELKKYPHITSKDSSSLLLGHRRLSIIDLTSLGHQPFVFNDLYLVYNGEIFNYIELRNELIGLGYSFETKSDTEVFLKAYHCWGVECFNKFNGMWAAAIYDKNADNIVLTRDRFGIKPLYYSIINNNLIFGSEIKFISSFFDKLESNQQMVYEYLRFNHIDHTNQTLFKDIYQLEPSTFMIYSAENIKVEHYFEIIDVNTSKDIIEKYLKESIKLRMRSDVEVGSLLSGGIDSSAILGIINKEKYINKFQTFSAVFYEEQFSEKKYIDEFNAENLKLKKHFIYPDITKFNSTIERLIYIQEEPFRSLAVFSQYEIYKYIKKNTNVVVLLNGQGADEIFAGYTNFYYVYFLELLKTCNFKLFLDEFFYFKKNRSLSFINILMHLIKTFISIFTPRKDKYKIFNGNFIPTKPFNKFRDLLKNNLYQNLTFSALREYLKYEDKNSMRFSLESRLPFLDYRLVLSVYSLSNQDKIRNGVSKFILREILKNKIPQETLDRKDKMGFVSPQEIWQKTILKSNLDLAFEDIKRDGLFSFINTEQLIARYNAYQDNRDQDWAFVWRVYCLYKWKKVWSIV
ncbi:asparagine synthase (glutamine-hydrolyzing) [Campylobacter hyointestinalis]|uniref:asparagine synthase (glutamine-hydrolyzing) n=1 Tax=Campylobacter hyointestinalis TaxID=198 RepID=UPI00255766E3|nr:asparagine synthase (glutamine-hydrolyzing) [Campylobacter hyointestinalis]MDL2346081.1 asparagine synthase (glutamine-hydrolyzing) [Campylobacter hyointestinalis]MDL2347821.1 asparagine synthase (glutamine-hydrolyzing) [Campylobacter hyointestinalis]MDL2349563.1 asparagine synthase (glutamine-hydrolyzing) [Campylobacter hyointestinalis]MDM1025762.1 asparagine synthase (glutamine-hydrolyzing) [Campylobacter hyointestinalis]MDM1028419.1 asparagine synthase (glutamine-hydrolyzing) [Campylobac